ncbi:MAG: hypothetical protein HZB16_09540 [Armatimonadetes bacterium]|nr:hypothetical protein [Armatimonadota bacterium]
MTATVGPWRWCALALSWLAAAASGLVLSPEPDLAVELSDEGRVTGLMLQQRPRPVLGLGGFELADLAQGTDRTRWCPIPASIPADLGHGGPPSVSALLAPAEDGPRPTPAWLFGGQWKLTPAGVTIIDDQGAGLSSAVAALAPRDAAAGSMLRLVCPVTDDARAGASFTLRVLLRGAPPGRVGVLALSAAGRAQTNWVACQPERLRGEWTEWTARVFAPPNTAGLMLIVAGEGSEAPLECAGAWLVTHATGAAEAVEGRLQATADGATFAGAAQGLRLNVDYRSVSGALRLSGRLSTTTPAPRAVCLTFRLPLDGSGWRWWYDPRRAEPIASSSLRTLCTWQHLGDGHLYSPWPLACVSREAPAGAVVLAQPTEQPLLTRFGFRQEDGLFASLDLGLDPASGHDSVAFELAVFAAEPRWGLRSALERHAAVFPAAPSPPAPHGAWFAGIDPGALPDPRRLGLRYDELAGEHPEWAARAGLVALSRWQPWAEPTGAGFPRRDSTGRAWYPQATPPGPPLEAALTSLERMGRGVVVDGLATGWAGWDADDLDAAHWAATDLPLSVSRARRGPALPASIRNLDLLAAAAEHLRRQGRTVLGGPDPAMPLPWVLPYLDVLSGGLRSPEFGHLLWLRALAPSRPITYLEPDLLNPATTTGILPRLWSDALLVGAYPGPIGLLTPDLANANASWFARHLPLLGPLTAAGWRPVPYASVSDDLVELQRYGEGDSLALVLRNASPRERTVRLTLHPSALGLAMEPGAPLPVLVDVAGPAVEPVPLMLEFDRWQATVVVGAGQSQVLRPQRAR